MLCAATTLAHPEGCNDACQLVSSSAGAVLLSKHVSSLVTGLGPLSSVISLASSLSCARLQLRMKLGFIAHAHSSLAWPDVRRLISEPVRVCLPSLMTTLLSCSILTLTLLPQRPHAMSTMQGFKDVTSLL